jgi:glycosyltransferase involved in cell wall biosynthesis
MIEVNTYPKISIIMPTYNRAAYIIETIESITGQTYSNWELIIVDDGSEDNTEEIVMRLKDERIQFYKAGKIGIGIKLKNIGIERASGELIAFIDSDDLWAPLKLEKQVAALQQYPDAVFSLTGGYTFKKTGEPLEYYYKVREGIKYDNVFLSFFKSEVAALPQSLLFRRQCLPVIHEFIASNPHSDVEFLPGLALHFKAVILYESLLYRRIHDTNFSAVNWERGYYEWIGVVNKYRADKVLPSAIAKDSLFKLYINFGEKCLRYKKRGAAIGKFFQAWKNKPFSIVPLKKIGKAVSKVNL